MRRTCLTILVFLLLGAMINVGVAWWLAARPISYVMPFPKGDTGWFQRDLHEAIGISASYQHMYINIGAYLANEHYGIEDFDMTPMLGPGEWNARAPRIAMLRDDSPLAEYVRQHGGDQYNHSFTERVAGWPCWSLHGYVIDGDWADQTIYESSGRVPIPESWRVKDAPKWLPFNPIWPGFYLNTLLYAASLWIVTLGPLCAQRSVRTWLRHRRGRCLTCGYDLRGTPANTICPECGTRTH